MKKNIKYVLILLILLTLSFFVNSKAYAETCETLEVPKVDKLNELKLTKEEFCNNHSCYFWQLEYKCVTDRCEKVNDLKMNYKASKEMCQKYSECKWVNTTKTVGHALLGANEGKCEKDTSNPASGSGNYIIKKNTSFKCDDVKLFTSIWLYIRIIAPFLVVLFGSLDYFKAIMASDEKRMKEARGKFNKRLIAFLLLIILPFVVQFIFENVGTYGAQNTCLLKCILTNDTSSKGCD